MESLGKYQLIHRLGAGTSAEGWLARSDGIEYILKVFYPASGLLAEEEFQVLELLDHPNIARALRFEQTGDRAVIVFAAVLGKSLPEVDPQSLSEMEIVSIIRQLFEGLQHAHERDILHRDIKPDNILITPDRQALILDFGASHTISFDPNEKRVEGSYRYMAPEQLVGRPVFASDIWSLGLTLYEWLTGVHPNPAKNLEQLELGLLKWLPTPVQLLDDRLSPYLGQLIGGCLEIDLVDRYKRCDEVLADLSKPSFAEKAEDKQALVLALLPASDHFQVLEAKRLRLPFKPGEWIYPLGILVDLLLIFLFALGLVPTVLTMPLVIIGIVAAPPVLKRIILYLTPYGRLSRQITHFQTSQLYSFSPLSIQDLHYFCRPENCRQLLELYSGVLNKKILKDYELRKRLLQVYVHLEKEGEGAGEGFEYLKEEYSRFTKVAYYALFREYLEEDFPEDMKQDLLREKTDDPLFQFFQAILAQNKAPAGSLQDTLQRGPSRPQEKTPIADNPIWKDLLLHGEVEIRFSKPAALKWMKPPAPKGRLVFLEHRLLIYHQDEDPSQLKVPYSEIKRVNLQDWILHLENFNQKRKIDLHLPDSTYTHSDVLEFLELVSSR